MHVAGHAKIYGVDDFVGAGVIEDGLGMDTWDECYWVVWEVEEEYVPAL